LMSALTSFFFIISFVMSRPPPRFTLFPYTTLFRSFDALPGLHAQFCLGGKDHVHTRAELDQSHALPALQPVAFPRIEYDAARQRSEEHTSELQSHLNLVCRLLLEKKKKKQNQIRSQ